MQATIGRRDIQLVAVLPQEVNRSQEYLKDLGLSIEEVKQASFKSIGVRATPTFILVDSAGIVTSSWVGRLAASEESEVLSRLQVDGGSQAISFLHAMVLNGGLDAWRQSGLPMASQ